MPIFATLYVNAQLVDYATKQGIYVLAIKEDTMDLYNYQQVTEGKSKQEGVGRGRSVPVILKEL